MINLFRATNILSRFKSTIIIRAFLRRLRNIFPQVVPGLKDLSGLFGLYLFYFVVNNVKF